MQLPMYGYQTEIRIVHRINYIS